jgi:hypothetical protein
MSLFEIIAIILIILWLGGFTLHIAGSAIHLLLVLAVIFFVIRFFKRAA